MLPPRGETVLPPSGEGELPPVLPPRGETVLPPSGEGELPPSGENVYISERKKKKSKKTRKGKQIYFEDEQEEMEEVIEEGTRRVQWRKRNDKIYNAEVCIAEEEGIVGTIVDSGATVGVIDVNEAEILEEDGFVIYKEAKKVEEIVFGKDEYRCTIIGEERQGVRIGEENRGKERE